MARDYYEILEVSRTSTDQEIKSAYRKIAMKFHPDRNPGDKAAEDRFKEAAEAYSVLSDPDKRKRYDAYGHAGVSGSAGAGGFGLGAESLTNAASTRILVLSSPLIHLRSAVWTA